jgi:hypothetical protein
VKNDVIKQFLSWREAIIEKDGVDSVPNIPFMPLTCHEESLKALIEASEGDSPAKKKKAAAKSRPIPCPDQPHEEDEGEEEDGDAEKDRFVDELVKIKQERKEQGSDPKAEELEREMHESSSRASYAANRKLIARDAFVDYYYRQRSARAAKESAIIIDDKE